MATQTALTVRAAVAGGGGRGGGAPQPAARFQRYLRTLRRLPLCCRKVGGARGLTPLCQLSFGDLPRHPHFPLVERHILCWVTTRGVGALPTKGLRPLFNYAGAAARGVAWAPPEFCGAGRGAGRRHSGNFQSVRRGVGVMP